MEFKKEDEIIRLLKKIEKNTAPAPRWQQILIFIFTHLVTIILIIITAFLVWKMYSLLGTVSDKVNVIKEGVTQVLSLSKGLKFWE